MTDAPGPGDYRDPLANERTFLAWIRTALALIAGAVAVVQLLPPLPMPGLRTALGVVLGVAGPATALLAHRRWVATDEAMRNRRPLPRTHAPTFVTVAVVVVGALVLLFALVRHGA